MKNLLNRILVIVSLGLVFGMTAQAWNVFDVNGFAEESNSFKKGRWSLEIVCEETVSPDGSRTRKCRLVIIKESTSRASLTGVLNIDSRKSTATLTNLETEDQKEPLVVDEEVVLDATTSRIFGYKSVSILPNKYEIKKGGAINLKFKGTEPIVIKPSQSLKNKLDKADELFAKLEEMMTKIETSKTIEKANLETFDKLGMEIANTLKATFDEVSANAQLAAKTQGKEGNATDLEYFENQAERHIKKANSLSVQAERIEQGIVEGKIIGRDCCVTRPRSSLEIPNILTNASFSKTENSNCNANFETESENIFLESIKSSKSVAVPCVSFCSAQLWVPCAACVARAVITGTSKYNEFMNCWNGCGSKKTDWGRRACRAACLAKFVFWIY